jgi:hypothetical protein
MNHQTKPPCSLNLEVYAAKSIGRDLALNRGNIILLQQAVIDMVA